MDFIEELSQDALVDDYLNQLIYKLDVSNFKHLFKIKEIEEISDKEFHDSLRFADILSRSEMPDARNISLKIIGLLLENPKYKLDKTLKLFAASVMMKLGNFPSLEILGGIDEIDDEEVIREKIIKSVMQLAPNGQKIFTDAQYQIFEKLKDSNNYSFSGPTSFGKSFIMESFIEHLIKTRNAADNIVILVPTRALIAQVVLDLKDKFSDKYEVISHPKVPLLYRGSDKKFIFVFTAERLVAYFSDSSNPIINYLFVDEAHKLLADDSRTPLLYHTLYQAARKGVNLYFASPNIPNSGVFLDLFNRNSEDSLTTEESPVTQNRYFIDLLNKKSVLFTDFGEKVELEKHFGGDNLDQRLRNMVLELSGESQSIIYCNTISYTIELARRFSETVSPINNKKINELISLIKDSIHEQYFLIDCLKKGIAFHYGGIPQRIREKIEELFRSGDVRFLFCTSTLLEGVNLPAKNIFILSSKKGSTCMNSIDFWNLAGRAGRLTKDLGGNIFCCRVFAKKGYWNSEDELKLLESRNVESLEPAIMRKKDQNLYKNMERFLNNRPFTNSSLSNDKKKSIEAYGNIVFYQNMTGGESVLLSRFLSKNNSGRETLKRVQGANQIPKEILAQTPNIKLSIQNEILNHELTPLPTGTKYDNCLNMLKLLYKKYHWETEESGGRKPLIPPKVGEDALKYFALLISYWVDSKPLSFIISHTLKYHSNNSIWVETDSILGGRQLTPFDNSRMHINAVINKLMSDLENNIRFKIKGYVKNYSLLLKYQGVESNDNWTDYLEYGSTNKMIIEIQNAGFPRELATFLVEYHADCFTMEGNEIVDFNSEKLYMEFDHEKFSEEYEELAEMLDWDQRIIKI